MSRSASLLVRFRSRARPDRPSFQERLADRRARFIREQRLSPAEAAHLAPGFDPGPEYDLDLRMTIPQENPQC